MEQSLGGAEMRSVLRCQVCCRGQPLCPLKLTTPLAKQSSSVGNRSVVLGESAFDLCEVLGSVTLSVEKCHDAWGRVRVIKAVMLAVCPTWYTVTTCLQDVCVFQSSRVALWAGGGHVGRRCQEFERFLRVQGRQTCWLGAGITCRGR